MKQDQDENNSVKRCNVHTVGHYGSKTCTCDHCHSQSIIDAQVNIVSVCVV